MKKFKLLTSLSALTVLSGGVALTTTSCSSDTTEMIISRDVNFIGVAPAGMQKQIKYYDNILMPVPVIIMKNGLQEKVTKVAATTKDVEYIQLAEGLDDAPNTFRVFGKKEGTATINVEAETESGIKMTKSITTIIKSIADCGYIRYTDWDSFFSTIGVAEGLFPVPTSARGEKVVNNPTGIIDFLSRDYVSLGMLTEGTHLSMFDQLAEMTETTETEIAKIEEAIENKYIFTGGQMYWRTTELSGEFMYGLEITQKEQPGLDISWAAYGEITARTFEYDETYTVGNVSTIVTMFDDNGPNKISKFADAWEEPYTVTIPDVTKVWVIEWKNTEQSGPGGEAFYSFIPYVDFGGENGIKIV